MEKIVLLDLSSPCLWRYFKNKFDKETKFVLSLLKEKEKENILQHQNFYSLFHCFVNYMNQPFHGMNYVQHQWHCYRRINSPTNHPPHNYLSINTIFPWHFGPFHCNFFFFFFYIHGCSPIFLYSICFFLVHDFDCKKKKNRNLQPWRTHINNLHFLTYLIH